MLTWIDEHSGVVGDGRARNLNSEDVLKRSATCSFVAASPYLCADNGPEVEAKKVCDWLAKISVKTLLIEPGIPWDNGYYDSVNGRLRDEALVCKQFEAILEAKVLIDRWRRHNNTVRRHGSLTCRPRRLGRSSRFSSFQLRLQNAKRLVYRQRRV